MSMLSLHQSDLKQALLAACRRLGSDQVVYRSEWLGTLPYGQYHCVEVAGEQVSHAFPSGWQYEDLAALVRRGVLEIVAEFRPQADSDDVEVRLRVLPIG